MLEGSAAASERGQAIWRIKQAGQRGRKGHRILRRHELEMVLDRRLGEPTDPARDDRLAEPDCVRQRTAAVDLAIGKDDNGSLGQVCGEAVVGQVVEVEAEGIVGPGGRDPGAQPIHGLERPTGDGDAEITTGRSKGDARVDQHLDPLVGFDGPEKEDLAPPIVNGRRRR